jgi:hypothetical protein
MTICRTPFEIVFSDLVVLHLHHSAVHDFLHSELRDLQAEDLVLMIDALDVWMQLPKEHMISRFDEIDGNQVVIGADKKCWPNDMKGVSLPDVISFSRSTAEELELSGNLSIGP